MAGAVLVAMTASAEGFERGEFAGGGERFERRGRVERRRGREHEEPDLIGADIRGAVASPCPRGPARQQPASTPH